MEWVSIIDRLPSDNEKVKVKIGYPKNWNSNEIICEFEKTKFGFSFWHRLSPHVKAEILTVTHWMPLENDAKKCQNE